MARAVRSVLAQRLPSFELIVVNDGSTDHGRQEVAKIVDARIRIVDQDNAGVSAARNRGIAEARGNLIAFLDADDEWLEDYLCVIARLHRSCSQCDVFATSYYYGGGDGRTRPAAPKGVPRHPWEGTKDFPFSYEQDPPFNMSCLTVTRQAIASLGGFPEGVAVGEDLLVRMQLILNFKMAYSTYPCSIYWAPSSLRPGRAPQYPDLVAEKLENLMIAATPPQAGEVVNFLKRWHRGRCIANLCWGQRDAAKKEIAILRQKWGWSAELSLLHLLSTMPTPTAVGALELLKKMKAVKRQFHS